MNRLSGLPLLLALFLLLNGCNQRLGDLTIASTKNVGYTTGASSNYVEAGECEGKDIDYVILFIPTGTPNLEDAIDRCLNSANGSLLTNVVIRRQFIYFVLGAQSGFLVEADVWTEATTSDLLDPDKEIYELVEGPDGLQLVSTTNGLNKKPIFDHQNPKSFTVEHEAVSAE